MTVPGFVESLTRCFRLFRKILHCPLRLSDQIHEDERSLLTYLDLLDDLLNRARVWSESAIDRYNAVLTASYVPEFAFC